MWAAIGAGFLSSLGLIVAIGAQNALVLRQGLRREHVAWVVVVCALSDAVLISFGVMAVGWISQQLPMVLPLLRWGGVAFLVAYGLLRLRAASQGGAALVPGEAAPEPLMRVLLTCLLLTWANPHVWLDTVVLLGSLSTAHGTQAPLFGLGAALASLMFFPLLGYGARLLAPVFARPRAWVVLEVLVGILMLALAAGLAISPLPGA